MQSDFVNKLLKNDDQAYQKLNKFESEQSLVNFVELGWHCLEPGVNFVSNWAVHAICDHLEAVTDGSIRRLLINVPPGCTKALPIDTPILTPYRWKNHGDLVPGDYVFDDQGEIKIVKGVTSHDIQPCYKITFNDKVSIVAAEDHLWTITRDFAETPRKRRVITVKTKQLWARNNSQGRLNNTKDRVDCIPVNKPVELPKQYQLIEPYVLGAWLGDGASNDGCIYVTEYDRHIYESYGELKVVREADGIRGNVDFYRVRVDKLRLRLRVLGLLNNKHIPDNYINCSIYQRWELVRGLMDTDGACDKGGRCSFSNKNRNLVYGLQRILNSLGIRATLRTRISKLNGIEYGYYYMVEFRPNVGDVIFKLSRKQDRVRIGKERCKNRYIESVEKIEPRVVNCIEVDGGLYLAGENLITTHNSMTTCVFFPAWEWGPKNLSHYRYISFSHEQNLAIRDNVRCRDLIQSEWYQENWGHLFEMKSDQNAKKYYENSRTGWRQAVAAQGLTGKRGDRIISDDPHSVRGADSDTQREEVLQIFSETVPTRLNKQAESAIIVIMQRVHERDVSGLILAKELGYEHLMLPMRFEEERRCYSRVKPSYIAGPNLAKVFYDIKTKSWKPYDQLEEYKKEEQYTDPKIEERYNVDTRVEDGQLIDPVRFPETAVDELEAALSSWGGNYAIAGQLQQRPAPRGGGMFKKSDFQFLDTIGNIRGKIVRGWDLAASDKKTSPYTVGVKMMLATDGRLIVLDVNRFKKTPGAMEEELKFTVIRDGYNVTQSIPQDPGQAGKTQKAAFAKLLHGYTVKFSPETGSKLQRAEPLAAQAEAGNLYVVRGPWNDEFINEHCAFGKTAEFKDQVDASSRAYGVLLVKKPTVIGGAPTLIEQDG